jgi:O-antigen/teichoic acid export membrane protein
LKTKLSRVQTLWSVETPAGPAGRSSTTVVSSQPHESTAMGRHALLMVSSAIGVAVLNYALNIILGWSLPPDQYGQVGVSQTLIFICLWLISAGLPWVVTRALAQAHDSTSGPEQREEAWRTYKTARLANIGLTLLVVTSLQVAFYAGWLPLESSYAPLILMVGITVAALGFGSMPNAGLQGLFRFGRISALRVAEAVVNIIISVGLVLAGYGAAGALGGFAAAAVFAALAAVWSMSGTHSSRVEGWGGLEAVRTAVPMTLAVFSAVLLTNIDLLAIKFMGGLNSDVLSGGYQVAAVLSRAPLFIATALVGTYYPRIAQETGNRQSARELIRFAIVGILPINLVLSLGAPAVVLFFFPAQYAASGPLLTVLAAGSACLVFATALAAVMQARHQVMVPALVMTWAVLAQVVGLATVVPIYGTMGAAVVSATAGALAVILLAWGCRNMDLAPPRLARYGIALAVLALPILVLTLFFTGWSRPFVALWVAGSFTLYIMALFALNLLDAQALAGSALISNERPLGHIVRRILAGGAWLNGIGRRWLETSYGN